MEETAYDKITRHFGKIREIAQQHGLDAPLKAINVLNDYAWSAQGLVAIVCLPPVDRETAVSLVTAKPLSGWMKSIPSCPIIFRNGPGRIELKLKNGKTTTLYPASGGSQEPIQSNEIATFIAHIEAPWLRDSEIILIDAQTTRNWYADAVILLFDARLGLGLSDKAVIDILYSKQHTKNLFIAALHTDELAETDHEQVKNYLRQQTSGFFPFATFRWFSGKKPGQDMQAFVTTVTQKEEYEVQRGELVRDNLLTIVTGIRQAIQDEDTVGQGKALNDRLEAEKLNQENSRLAWEEILHRLADKQNGCSEYAIQQAMEFRDQLAQRLSAEVNLSKSPIDWWSHGLQMRLDLEVRNFSKEAEYFINQKIAADLREIRQLIARNFLVQADLPTEAVRLKLQPGAAGQSPKLKDWQHTRILVRAGTMVGTGLLVGALGPFGLAIGAGLLAGSELYAKKKIDQQGMELEQPIHLVADKTYSFIRDEITEAVSSSYTLVIESIKTARDAFIKQSRETVSDTALMLNEIVALRERNTNTLNEIINQLSKKK